MITFDRVSKRYDTGLQALRGVSFELGRGQMAFLTGHSGAGKSTLLKLIPLIERPSGGRLLIDGVDVSRVTNAQVPLLRRRIGLIFQDHNLLFDRSVYDNVALPLEIAGHDPREIPRRTRAALDKVGLLRKERANPIALSTGERQRVGVARAVVNRPAILLADEPTGNLDPELSQEIMQLFIQFSQIGVTTLIASHDLALIQGLGHPLLHLEGGEMIANGLA